MTHKSIELTDLELDVFLADAQLPVLVDLWAPWCAPCRAMSPIIDKLARNTAGHLLVAKLDVEKYPSIMQRFSVRGIPTLLLFNPAQDPVRLVGAQSLAQLNEWLANHQVNISVPTVHVQQDESLEWGSFYGDDELLAFIAARVLRHAREREITTGQSRYWIEGKGTLAAAMVHQPDSNAFERITGLSPALGCLLDREILHVTGCKVELPVHHDNVLFGVWEGADRVDAWSFGTQGEGGHSDRVDSCGTVLQEDLVDDADDGSG